MATVLLQMSGNITYSTAADYNSLIPLLATVQLLAMSYHPQIENLIYLLYGTNKTNGIYKTAQLEIWRIDNSSRTVIYNATLNNTVNSTDPCQMEVSTKLLLIQCYSYVFVYVLTNNGSALMDVNPYNITYKGAYQGLIGGSNIVRFGTISAQKYAVFNGTEIIITVYKINDTSVFVSSSYLIPMGTYTQLFSIFMSQDYVIWGFNKTNATIIYTYLPCILYGYNQDGGICGPPKLIATPMAKNVSKNFKVRQANSSNSIYVMWVLIEGEIHRFQLYALLAIEQQQFTGFGFDDLAFNNKSILFFTYNGAYQLRSFQVATVHSQTIDYDFDGNMKFAAISSNKKQLTVYKGTDPVCDQYLIIKNCSDYNATLDNSFCHCQFFDGIFCSLANNISLINSSSTPNSSVSTSKGLPSFAVPVIAVGAAIGITVIVLVTRLVYMKCCKGPKNNRIPYKYDQAELMSFQV